MCFTVICSSSRTHVTEQRFTLRFGGVQLHPLRTFPDKQTNILRGAAAQRNINHGREGHFHGCWRGSVVYSSGDQMKGEVQTLVMLIWGLPDT